MVILMFYLKARCVYGYHFFFQAEDGIRDGRVTGVQTCALPIYLQHSVTAFDTPRRISDSRPFPSRPLRKGSGFCRMLEIGRASCRERVYIWVVYGVLER